MSTTHGAENHALAAARAVLKIFREQPVVEHMWKSGQSLIDGLNEAARTAGVSGFFEAGGVPCSPNYTCYGRDRQVSLPLRTLFLQEMVKEGVLINYVAPSYSHTAADVDRTVAAAGKALRVYARALEEGWERHLEGPPIKPVFRVRN
jgi:glutamate-1-semialdehyde 2,1-aminomutase